MRSNAHPTPTEADAAELLERAERVADYTYKQAAEDILTAHAFSVPEDWATFVFIVQRAARKGARDGALALLEEKAGNGNISHIL